jgi:hypothetical protein
VIHFVPFTPFTTETTSKSECAVMGCYASAWDVNAPATVDLPYGNAVVKIVAADNVILDAAPFETPLVVPPSPSFPADLQALQAAGLWFPASCGGAPCTYTSTPTAYTVSASWQGTVMLMSAHRVAFAHMHSDWALGFNTFGAPW